MAEIRCKSCGDWFKGSTYQDFCDDCKRKIGQEQRKASEEAENVLATRTPWLSRDNADEKISEVRKAVYKGLAKKIATYDSRCYRIRCPGCGDVLDSSAKEDYTPDLCVSCKNKEDEAREQQRRAEEELDEIKRRYS